MKESNYFCELISLNVDDKTKKKNGSSFLPWAYAWGELKKLFPDSNYKIYENETGFNYFTDGRTAWVKVGVTVNGIEHIEYLPIMDNRNRSITLENITSVEVNKTIQRALTKAIARHGLGLSIYAGEDFSETDTTYQSKPPRATVQRSSSRTSVQKKSSENQSSKEPIKDYRSELREFIKANGLDGSEIANICSLSNTSTQEDFKEALIYCQEITKKK